VFAKETHASRKALSRLVSAVIGRELEALEITANEPPPESLRHRQIRFDINCKAADGEWVNVEMCLNPDDFEPVRLEYYAARLLGIQDIRGEGKTYSDLKPTYQIAILVNKTFFPDGDFFHRFEYVRHASCTTGWLRCTFIYVKSILRSTPSTWGNATRRRALGNERVPSGGDKAVNGYPQFR